MPEILKGTGQTKCRFGVGRGDIDITADKFNVTKPPEEEKKRQRRPRPTEVVAQ
jgi:hypothetical protein